MHLLPCAPAEWLDVGKEVRISQIGTVFGKLSFAIRRSAPGSIAVELSLPSGIRQLSLNLFMSEGYQISGIGQVNVGGQAAEWQGSMGEHTVSLPLEGLGGERSFVVAVAASRQ